MHWKIVAPFFGVAANERWIDNFVEGGFHSFEKLPFRFSSGDDWHRRSKRATPLAKWWAYWSSAANSFEGADGVITVFPQLATATALRRRLARREDLPVVAWCFNIGRLRGGVFKLAARMALSSVDMFVVHSNAEVDLISNYLGISKDRVRFIRLQRANIPFLNDIDENNPFIVSMGSANRDYKTLIEAARKTGLPVTIVAARRCVEGLDLPTNVAVISDLTPTQCLSLAQKARFSVVPLAKVETASGQVTVIEAQRMGRAVIATESAGTIDYIENGRTGLLIPAQDVNALAEAMRDLWQNSDRRDRLATNARNFAAKHLSDEAAGVQLRDILDEVASRYASRNNVNAKPKIPKVLKRPSAEEPSRA